MYYTLLDIYNERPSKKIKKGKNPTLMDELGPVFHKVQSMLLLPVQHASNRHWLIKTGSTLHELAMAQHSRKWLRGRGSTRPFSLIDCHKMMASLTGQQQHFTNGSSLNTLYVGDDGFSLVFWFARIGLACLLMTNVC